MDVSGRFVFVPRCVPWDCFQRIINTIRRRYPAAGLVVFESNPENLERYTDEVRVIPYLGRRFIARKMRGQLLGKIDWKRCEGVVIPVLNQDGLGYEQLFRFAMSVPIEQVFLAKPKGELEPIPKGWKLKEARRRAMIAAQMTGITVELLLVVSLFIPLYLLSLLFSRIFRLLPGGGGAVVFHAYQPIRNAGSRYRTFKMLPYLKALGVRAKAAAPPGGGVYDRFYSAQCDPNQKHRFALYVLAFQLPMRLIGILRSALAPCVVVHYFLLPFGPPILEYLLRIMGPRLIYEYDDALYAYPRYERYLKRVFPFVDAVVAGNAEIGRWAERRGAKKVVIVPTCIDPDYYRPKADYSIRGRQPVVGWIGNPSSLTQLEDFLPVLLDLQKELSFTLRIVSTGFERSFLAHLSLPGNCELVEWSLESEREMIESFDIGLMPLRDDLVSRGKCAFKLLQYMACGLPAVASPVGANSEIVRDGINGVLATSAGEWRRAVKDLLVDKLLRERLGKQAKVTAREYGFDRHAAIWRDLLAGLGVKIRSSK